MTNLTATFSNGHRDEYKGDRAVRAAWAIIDRETGAVLASGHSLDRVRAQKTAEGNVQDAVRLDYDAFPSFYVPRSTQYLVGESGRYLIEQIRKHGLADDVPAGKLKLHEALRRAKAANARRNAAKRAKVTIEVVDL